MDVKFLKIVVLAMDVDGEFQQQELDMLKHIITTHPEFRGISDSVIFSIYILYTPIKKSQY